MIVEELNLDARGGLGGALSRINGWARKIREAFALVPDRELRTVTVVPDELPVSLGSRFAQVEFVAVLVAVRTGAPAQPRQSNCRVSWTPDRGQARIEFIDGLNSTSNPWTITFELRGRS